MKILTILSLLCSNLWAFDNFINKMKPLEKRQFAQNYTLNKIQEAIYVLNPKIEYWSRKEIAKYIFQSANKFNLDYRLFLVIISVESRFNNKAVSHTGDYSLAQIYKSYWSKKHRKDQLKETGHLLNTITESEFHAIMVMGEILYLNKKESQNKNPYTWFAHYHSRTPKYKKLYLKKIRAEYQKIKHIDLNKYLHLIR